jgi:exodeoxyribonuclease V beta subunit
MNASLKTPAPLDVFDCPLEGVNLIEASAGTGKTWTICGLYLRLLLERDFTVQQILVVTFTNAATAELRERIRTRILELRRYLNDPADGKADPFIRRLAGDLQRRPRATLETLSARLELALASFDEAAIFTIHGFCQRALADNPFAAGLPMRTELIESDDDLVMEVARDFWRRHVAADAVAPELARHLAARGDSPRKYADLLKRHLGKPLARHLWPPDLDAPPIAAKELHQPYREARTHWLTHRDDINALLGRALTQLSATTYNPDSLAAAAAHWDDLCRDDDPLATPGKKARLFRLSQLALRTKKKCITPSHDFFIHAETYMAQRDAHEHSLFLARCRLLKTLFAEGTAQLRTLKRSRQVVAFNDMLANVHERLHHPDYPGLEESIRTRFPAALIDEFQDTDPLQLAIFRRIYSTAGSPVFLVGDPKQAIYSFRHADLHSYLRASAWADRQWSLTHNQRSSRPLLEGLNRLFGSNGGAFVLPEVRYRPVEFGEKPRTAFIDDSAPRAPLQLWRLPDAGGGLPKPLARQAAVAATAGEIARLLQAAADGQIILDGRPLAPGDIAVLVRSRALGGEVKRALAALQVGAVELSRDSIFGSSEARDWEIVLTAIASPSRDSLLRAALATALFGLDANEIERVACSDTELPRRIAEFMEYRELWVKRGFGVMYRQLFADQAVAKRLLAQGDGERRLTNFLHVGEELQMAAEAHPTPEALLRHLKSAQEDDDPVDTAQLRLESDQNLVQIVTIHACKGLEYPLVFCPFLCDGNTRFGGSGPEGLEYHDAALEPVIDFIEYADADPNLALIKAQIKLEQAAETVRLLYVALTRAVHRCYLVMGPYQTSNPREEAARSLLNWLAAGGAQSPAAWFEGKPTLTDLDAAWAAVAANSGGAIRLDPLPTAPGVPLRHIATDAAKLTTPRAPGTVAASWRMSSYSGLSVGARGEPVAGEQDLPAPEMPAPSFRPPDLPADDILRFPRGADAGDCIHAMFERIDFTERGGWGAAVAAALASHPQSAAGHPAPGDPGTAGSVAALPRMLLQLAEDVTTATLRPGLQLASVPLARRLTELEFNLPVRHLAAGALNHTLESWGYEVPSLNFGALEGYLKGFIDLVFEHEGRYFILDWKSNHLGYTAADYGALPVARAMADHGYHLQYLIYVLALDRYLRLRVANYRYATHFGGVLYLFVRGVRPSWPGDGDAAPGVFFHRPQAGTLRELNALLGAPNTAGVLQ